MANVTLEVNIKSFSNIATNSGDSPVAVSVNVKASTRLYVLSFHGWPAPCYVGRYMLRLTVPHIHIAS